MPAQSFPGETSNCADGGFKVFGNLIFDDCVKDSVSLKVWQFNTRLTMMFFCKLDSLLFVECEPFRWVRCMVWIVRIHNTLS